MASPAGSYLLVRHNRHSIRLRVPLDLVPRLGRGEIVRALGTADRRAARFIAAGIALRLRLLWAMIRKPTHLTPEALRRLADDWLRAAVAEQWTILERGDFAASMAPPNLAADDRRAFSAVMFGREAEHILGRITDEAAAGNTRHFDDEAGRLLAAAGHGKRTGTHERAILRQLILERFADLQIARVSWSDGNAAAMPPQLLQTDEAPLAGASTGVGTSGGVTEAPSSNTRSIAAAVAIFISRMRQNKATEKHVVDAQSDLTLLVEAFGGDMPVGSVTPAQAGRLAEALRSLPPHFRTHKDLAGLHLFAKAARARELGLGPLNFRTVNSYFVTMRNLFDQEVMAGQVLANPFAEKRQSKPSRFAEQDRTLRPDELEALFSSALFQGAKSPQKPYDQGEWQIDDWRFWAPLVALFTGARIGEIAQLQPSDIYTCDGVVVIDINERGGKTLKNRGTARIIPVHSRLEEIGLTRLSVARQAIKARLLLPSMPLPILGDPGKAASQWMSERLLNRLELKTRPGLGFHSLRHSLKTMLRDALVPDSVSNELLGHDDRSHGGVAAAYGRVGIGAMKDGLEKIKFPPAVLKIKPR